MDSTSRHRRHHSTENVTHKSKNKGILVSGGQSRKRPGSESDILEMPHESSLQHQDSIQLAYHHRPTFAALKGSTTGAGRHIKPVYIWTKDEVQKWVKRHAPRSYEKYSSKMIEHEITGRALISLNDAKLTRMGMVEPEIRNELVTEILKLRLKSYMQCFKGLEGAGMFEVM
ncbi:sterile alpha motif domain-containing protein 10-like [Styela clava]|uniref:protein aveugle-like n=1 Tax=Styela clava TaxID=7725 RepID=UPI001939A41D|nr:protein aveugle-like [Styela clava]